MKKSMKINESFGGMANACAARLAWQRLVWGTKQWPGSMERLPRGWEKVAREWAEDHGYDVEHGRSLASYAYWLYGDMAPVQARMLMDEAQRLSVREIVISIQEN